MKALTRKTAWWSTGALLVLSTLYWGWASSHAASETVKPESGISAADQHIDLSESQAKLVRIETITEHEFVQKLDAVGSIAFNDDRTVQVYPSYPGKIGRIFSDVGQDVKPGDPLYTIDSPDLLQAESTLVSAAGTRDLTTRALDRARQLYDVQGISQKDLQQTVSEQQSAEGAYQAARDTLRIFGKSDDQIDQLIASRHVDASLLVKSPIGGRVVARNAAPGLLAQPGSAPAPFAVADISVFWMLANVSESDVPSLKPGLPVEARVSAWPGRVYAGKVTNIGAVIDTNTHRAVVRSEISDPRHELRAGMLANFVILTGEARHAPAVPLNGIVREGDGSMTVWVTSDRHRFFRRVVMTGLQQNGLYQILDGLKPGEMVASDGAIFLSHAYETGTR